MHGEMARAEHHPATGQLMEEGGFGEGQKRFVLGSSSLSHRAAGMEMSCPVLSIPCSARLCVSWCRRGGLIKEESFAGEKLHTK